MRKLVRSSGRSTGLPTTLDCGASDTARLETQSWEVLQFEYRALVDRRSP